MNYDDLYAPLLSDAEISQINAEREERVAAAIAAQSEWHDATFGGCPCEAGLPVCTCGMESWVDPAPKRKPIVPIKSDLPPTLRNLLIAASVVTFFAWMSKFFPMGFAS